MRRDCLILSATEKIGIDLYGAVMPKRSKYPRLRSHSWRTAGGAVRVAYYFDRRAEGQSDIPLGTDYAEALRRWHELTFDAPLHRGTLREAFDAWEREALPQYEHASTRRDYALSLTQLRPVMGGARWADITLADLKAYLRKRSAKTRANRELSVLQIVWNWARGEGLTVVPWPAAGMAKARWKNKEHARSIEVTDAAYATMYSHADPLLRDAMDIASATGLRVRDIIALRLPDVREGVLHVTASKTGKQLRIDIAGSVVERIVERRRSEKAATLMLLHYGERAVTERMLTDRWARARTTASVEHPEVAKLVLRDMRKRAAQLAGSLSEAQTLLQHGSAATTTAHYRPSERVKPVR